ncbi:hypothetical protein R3P38DRAFT_2620088 [Favolaschia claudopus]|uniref:DUF6534 domain-containing protein n=1 Tax=Favolaschia claudopus TaxID=2862362 RepID=A0AAW0C007_9AGAR
MPLLQVPPHSFTFHADSTLGALLVGVLISYILFGLACMQTYIYSGRFPNDSGKMKLLIACVWLLDLGHVVSIGHMLYVLVISDFGHPELIASIPKSLGASSLINAVLAMCVQGFFSYRVYRLCKRLYVPILTWTLSFLFLGATSAVFVLGMQPVPFQVFETQWGWLLDSLWGIAAANDLIIAATLVFLLCQRKREESEDMTPVVDKVIMWTLETGLITSAAAILNLICFVTMKNNFIWIAWYVVTARLYSNSFLANLNSRGTLRTMTQIPISKPYPLFSSNAFVMNDDAFPKFQTTRISSSRTPFSDSEMSLTTTRPASVAFSARMNPYSGHAVTI